MHAREARFERARQAIKRAKAGQPGARGADHDESAMSHDLETRRTRRTS
jgi:DNA-directed RNA polymerase subunit K/omega